MSSDAKRAANARYNSKFSSFTIRVSKDEAERIKQAAADTSVTAYFVQAAREKMERDKNNV